MGRRAGRKRQLHARSRATTRAGRAPPPDLGTVEVRRLRMILNGRIDLPIAPLDALFSREFVDEPGYVAGRRYASLVACARRGWKIPDGSVAHWWRMISAGPIDAGNVRLGLASRSEVDDSAPDSVEGARYRLERMRRELWRPGEDGSVFQTTTSVVIDAVWDSWLKRLLTRLPERDGDFKRLGQLREGLLRLIEANRRHVGAPRPQAAE
jgi:hypothetical protein